MPKSKNPNASFMVIFKHCVTVAIAKWMIVRSRVPLPFDKRSRENSFLKDSREACTPKIVTLHTTEEVRSDFCTRPFTTQRNASSTQGHILFFRLPQFNIDFFSVFVKLNSWWFYNFFFDTATQKSKPILAFCFQGNESVLDGQIVAYTKMSHFA